MRKERTTIPVRSIQRNDGQIDWLPKNPRQWTKDDVERTAASIAEDPDFLEDRPLLVVPSGDEYVVFAGNLRREGAKKEKLTAVPAVVYYPDGDEDRQTIRRRAMKDNGSFGSWDFDELANGWDDLPLVDWGVPAWDTKQGGEMNLTTKGREGDENYDAFVDKFKPKLTTDDCYTPPEVYDALLAWIDEKIHPIPRESIVRPFFPGGDYENHDYPAGCVVIDNPPFSIYSEVVRFYIEHGIAFFLFGPSLTLFGPGKVEGVCYVIANVPIVYENGAIVSTSFVTNIVGGEDLIWVQGDLREKIAEKEDAELGRYDIPDNVLTSARIGKICTNARSDLRIKFTEAEKIRQLDGFKEIGKGLYGGGFLLSRAAAERAAAERAAIKIQLSTRERAIVAELDRQSTQQEKGPQT